MYMMDNKKERGEQMVSNITIPYVVEKGDNERVFDLWSRLHKDRIIFLGEAITEQAANTVVGQMLQLEAEDKQTPIYLYINSPGGIISAGLAIYDIMNYIRPSVYTFCIGSAASMASVILSSGEKGHRYCLPNADIMIHQARGGMEGVVADIERNFQRIVYLNRKIASILADNTGKELECVLEDLDRDNWFNAEEALSYGLIDKIITNREGTTDK